jgi:hypothetical protein
MRTFSEPSFRSEVVGLCWLVGINSMDGERCPVFVFGDRLGLSLWKMFVAVGGPEHTT